MTDAFQPPRGMRDLSPELMRKKNYVCEVLREVFESFGFEPLDTPALENRAALTGKYGPEAERLIYHAGLRDADDLALRYDLSVPLARYLSTAGDLPLPFKRYQIAKVWRGDRPQRGRYRELTQADVDIVGASSMEADAEIIVVLLTALSRLGLRATSTKINSRKLLRAIAAHAGVAEEQFGGLYRSIDKADKIGLEGVRLELSAVGLPAGLQNRMQQAVDQWLRGTSPPDRIESDLRAMASESPQTANAGIDGLLAVLSDHPPGEGEATLESVRHAALGEAVKRMRASAEPSTIISEDAIERVMSLLDISPGTDRRAYLASILRGEAADEGLREIDDVLAALDAAGVARERVDFDPSMVRGLDYYTGTIFETVVTEPAVGSITGGGRFDALAGLFGRQMPAVGTSLGVDRLIDVMLEHSLFPEDVGPRTQVFVTRFDDSLAAESIRLGSQLRASGIRTEVHLGAGGLGDQIRLALRRGAALLLIAGPDEVASGRVAIRDLGKGEQTLVPTDEVVAAVRALLD